jgi:hypothetical protein
LLQFHFTSNCLPPNWDGIGEGRRREDEQSRETARVILNDPEAGDQEKKWAQHVLDSSAQGQS